MTSDEQSSIAAHFADRERVAEYLVARDPLNEARRELVRRMVLVNVPAGSRILEVGCGIGTLTAELAQAGMVCKAIDASEEMITHARDRVGPVAEVELKDLFDESLSGQFSAVIANGVAPYYRDTGRFLKRIGSLLQSGGYAFIVHKNALFNFFALNKGTIEFFVENLLADLPMGLKERISGQLSEIPGLGEPQKFSSSAKVFRAQENPLTVADLYADAGLVVQDVRYCFIHASPPRIAVADAATDAGLLQMKYEHRWEGMFLGSQFLVVASRR